MEKDPKVVLMGEDIGKLGGVFRVTEGLQKDFGEDRVIDTPLAEAGIVGTAVGMALRGYRPVVEIQFDGFVYPAFDHIVSQVAKMRARCLGTVAMPMVIRIPVGGGIGAVEHHSESNEAYFAHTAGLKVVCVSNPEDAYWGIQQAIATDDPVIFYEPKRRYWDKGEVDVDRPSRRACSSRRRSARAPTAPSSPTARWSRRACRRPRPRPRRAGASRSIDLRSLSPLDLDTLVRLGREDRPPRRRARGVHQPAGSAPRSRRPSPSAASTTSRRPCCASAATTCPTRRAGSRRSSSPTSTACSTASTAPSPTESKEPHRMSCQGVPPARPR